jgi:hypothetical protein
MAIAIAAASGSNESSSTGAWGIGGPVGDGPGQAKAALAARQAQGWDAFPAYRRGSYVLYLPAATAVAASTAAVSTGVDAVGAVTDTNAKVSSALGGIGETFAVVHWLTTPNAWTRVAKFVVGGALVLIAAISVTNTVVRKPMTEKMVAGGETVGEVAQNVQAAKAASAATGGRGFFSFK